MNKGRKQAPETKKVTDEVHPEVAAKASADANALIALEAEVAENARALATQYGYKGALTVAAVEDEIRFYQRRTVEDCLELGTRLLLLREMSPHGEFYVRLAAIGINDRMARRFMGATLKFSKTDSKSVLAAAGNQTKLLELVTLDDTEIAELEAGGTARGITLDQVETMSVTELRTALREAKAEAEAKDRVMAELSERNNRLHEQASRPFKPKKGSPAKTAEDQATLDELSAATNAVDLAFDRLTVVVDELQSNQAEAIRGRALQSVQYLVVRMRDLVLAHGLEVSVSDDALGVRPAWLEPLSQAQAD